MRRRLLVIAPISLFTLALACIVFSRSAYAEEAVGGNTDQEVVDLEKQIEARKEKIKQIEKSIESYKKQIEQKQTESQSLRNQMSFLDNRQAKVELDIEATVEKLEATKLEIEALDIQITKESEKLERQKAALSELIRSIYMEGDKSVLEIIATNSTVAEFFQHLNSLEQIQTRVASVARSVRVSRSELEQKQTEAADRQTTYEQLASDLENTRQDLDEQIFAKQDLLNKTKSSEKQYQTLLSNLKSQYQSIENEISGIEQQVRNKRASQTDTLDDGAAYDGKLSWPTQSRYVTAYFYDPSYPYRSVFEHNAIDIRAAHGTPVHAAASGYIARAKTCTLASCYAYVMIVHADGISTVYGHLSGILVKDDQFVARGDLIGYSGATPNTPGAGPFTTGAHLHFEVRKDGIPVNPLSYLVKDY